MSFAIERAKRTPQTCPYKQIAQQGKRKNLPKVPS